MQRLFTKVRFGNTPEKPTARARATYDRSVLALKLKPIIAKQAKERQTLGLKSDEGGRTDEALGKIAGVGKDTIHKVETKRAFTR